MNEEIIEPNIEEVNLEIGDVKIHSYTGLSNAMKTLFIILDNKSVKDYLEFHKIKKNLSYTG
tara:strand:- start:171 stop:356 length:186 start_codon:yes stop_codon:yes gene_type:complete